jgi:hypothetical protein
MRKTVMMMALVALLVAVFASAALARDFQCTDNPCEGTSEHDRIFERGGDNVPDEIFGRQGRDRIRADIFGSDRDIVWGNQDNDRLNTADGDNVDEAHGGGGFDTCIVDPGDETFSCEEEIVVP